MFLFEVKGLPSYLSVIEYARLFLLCGELSSFSEGYANNFIFPSFVFCMQAYNTECISKIQDPRVKRAWLNCLLQTCYIRVFY